MFGGPAFFRIGLMLAIAPLPVVVLNRALAMANVHGASAALDDLRELCADVGLAEYPPYLARGRSC